MNENCAFFIDLFKTLYSVTHQPPIPLLSPPQQGEHPLYIYNCPVCEQAISHQSQQEPVCTMNRQISDILQMHIPQSRESWCICTACYGIVCIECCIDITLQTSLKCPLCSAAISEESQSLPSSRSNPSQSSSDDSDNYDDVIYLITQETQEQQEPMSLADYLKCVQTTIACPSQMCPICLQDQSLLDQLVCSHMYCRKCLFTSLTNNRKCPLCRSAIEQFKSLSQSQ